MWHWLFETLPVANWEWIVKSGVFWLAAYRWVLKPAVNYVMDFLILFRPHVEAIRNKHSIHLSCFYDAEVIHCENCRALYKSKLKTWYPMGTCAGWTDKEGQNVAQEGQDRT